MLVKDVMVSKNVLTVGEGDRLAVAAQKMLWGHLRHLPVLRDEWPVGLLTERDVLGRRGDGDGSWEDELVGNVMGPVRSTASPDEDVAAAASRMAGHGLDCLLVIQDHQLAGILTTTDLTGAAVGELFRQSPMLSRPVEDVMSPDVFTLRTNDNVMEAVDLMAGRQIRHLPVVDPDGRVVGMVSDRDVRAALGDPGEALEAWPGTVTGMVVSAIMTRDPVVVRARAPLSLAVAHLLDRKIGALPVVDDSGRLCGIISYVDVIRALEG